MIKKFLIYMYVNYTSNFQNFQFRNEETQFKDFPDIKSGNFTCYFEIDNCNGTR